jgi:hypothetical protein
MFSCWSFSVIPLHQILPRWVHPCLFMGLNTSSHDENRCRCIKLRHDLLGPCNSCLLVVLENRSPVHVQLVHEWLVSCPNCNLVLNFAGSLRHSSSQELQDGKRHFYWNWPESPTTTLISTDGVLLEICNRKEWCRAWSLIATTSHDRTLSIWLFQDSTDTSITFFVLSSRYMTCGLARVSWTLTKYNFFILSYHRAMSLWFCKWIVYSSLLS